MSRKHNCPKRGLRSKSRYPRRLAARGLKSAPPMEDVETLRARQSRRPRPWAGEDGDPEPTLADALAACRTGGKAGKR